MERKNVSEVSREGQMEARERLIKELEQSARRAQQVRSTRIAFLRTPSAVEEYFVDRLTPICACFRWPVVL